MKSYARRRRRLSEMLAVSFVRLAAAFTVVALVSILGYVLARGFWKSNRMLYPVLSSRIDSVSGLSLIVNKEARLDEASFPVVQGSFTDEYTTWKKIDGRDLDFFPYLADDIADPAAALGVDEVGYLVEVPGDTSVTVASVAARSGSLALVDSRAFAALDSAARDSVRVVPVRDLSLAVSPSVTELRENTQLSVIDEGAVARLFSGDVADWADLGGPSLQVRPLLPPPGHPLSDRLRDLGLINRVSPAALACADWDAYLSLLAETPGAVAVVPAADAARLGLDTIELARVESGWNLSLRFLFDAPRDSGKIGGISTIIVNTVAMILLTLLFAVPPGIAAAVYLVEYAREGRLVRAIRIGTETLAGVPSIIFGLFGMLVFVQGLGWGISLLSGSLTVTLMILPTIVRSAEEALKSVPRSLSEGSLALGATKVQTIFRVVLPAAFPAIASGIILAAGRALGETAALIYTMGSNYNLTRGLFDSTRTLATHVYLIIAEGISSDRAFASAAVLVFLLLVVNGAARWLIGRVGRMARA